MRRSPLGRARATAPGVSAPDAGLIPALCDCRVDPTAVSHEPLAPPKSIGAGGFSPGIGGRYGGMSADRSAGTSARRAGGPAGRS
jgi:hypothetical protein